MAIVQTLTKSAFIDAFKQSSRKDQFSCEALEAIFDYLEEYSDSTGESIELDIIAICCEWAEMTWNEAASSYDIDLSDCEDDEERIEAVQEHLQDMTIVAGMSDSQSFVFIQF